MQDTTLRNLSQEFQTEDRATLESDLSAVLEGHKGYVGLTSGVPLFLFRMPL